MTAKKLPPISLDIAGWEDQIYIEENSGWDVPALWELAEELPTYEIPLVGMNLDIQPWDGVGVSFLDFCRHAALVQKADLDYPIILTPEGNIADGRHRLAKAILLGHTTVRIKRLKEMPVTDLFFDEDGYLIEDQEE
jgi:hypothetical protein